MFNSFTNDSRVLKESLSLSRDGYHVEVIAHLDKDLKKEEKEEHFYIQRFSYLDRSVTKSRVKKLKAYHRYLKESIVYCKGFDIFHCNDLNTLPIGVIIKKFYNKEVKIVYDAHEYETETNGLSGMQKIWVKKLERFLIKYADATITVSDTIARDYVKLYAIKKPSLVLNTPYYQEIEKNDIFRETFAIAARQTIFLYQGSLNKGRGIEILLETFKNIDDKSVLVVMGYGELVQLVKAESKKCASIFYHEAVDPNVLLTYTASADFGISTIEDTCLSYRYCLPNKMFEYIMAEVPVIISNLPEMKKIVDANKIGVIVKENNSVALMQAIQVATTLDKDELKENLKKVKKIYHWEAQEKVLLRTYQDLFIEVKDEKK